ncbi:MAG: helix-turn-helix transcriptional regulator [Polaribacter sp.]
MTKNKEILKTIASKEVTTTLEKNRARIKNRLMLKESRKIALSVLLKLDELGWSQKDLADKMGVSKQQVNKIVKGKENLTLQTMISIQDILRLPILASYFAENIVNEKQQSIEQKSQEVPYQIPFTVTKSYRKKEVVITSRKKRYNIPQVNSSLVNETNLYRA